jgi:hypothetical protein
MTPLEMKYEAELLYESIASADAPGYDNKEWSHILTMAQEEVVQRIIDNGLDRNERAKKALSPILIPVEKSDTDLIDNSTVIPKSLVVNIDDDINQVTLERVYLDSGKIVKIKPISHDYYLSNLKNPYKKPDKTKVYWRFDELVDSSKSHVIITDLDDIADVSKYMFVSVTKPTPIIIEDANYDETYGSIDGENFTDYTTSGSSLSCILGNSIHRNIVEEAVKIAFAADKDQLGYQIRQLEEKENIQN